MSARTFRRHDVATPFPHGYGARRQADRLRARDGSQSHRGDPARRDRDHQRLVAQPDLWDAWWDKHPPERTTEERQAAGAARRRAERNGWCPQLALDEDELDEPRLSAVLAVPRRDRQRRGRGVPPACGPASGDGHDQETAGNDQAASPPGSAAQARTSRQDTPGARGSDLGAKLAVHHWPLRAPRRRPARRPQQQESAVVVAASEAARPRLRPGHAPMSADIQMTPHWWVAQQAHASPRTGARPREGEAGISGCGG